MKVIVWSSRKNTGLVVFSFLKDVIPFGAMVIGQGKQIIIVYERYSRFTTSLYYLETFYM